MLSWSFCFFGLRVALAGFRELYNGRSMPSSSSIGTQSARRLWHSPPVTRVCALLRPALLLNPDARRGRCNTRTARRATRDALALALAMRTYIPRPRERSRHARWTRCPSSRAEREPRARATPQSTVRQVAHQHQVLPCAPRRAGLGEAETFRSRRVEFLETVSSSLPPYF